MIDANNKANLIELASATMPFGKYSGRRLYTIPEEYFIWLARKGMPEGKLGTQIAAIQEIQLNGLEGLLQEIDKKIHSDAPF